MHIACRNPPSLGRSPRSTSPCRSSFLFLSLPLFPLQEFLNLVSERNQTFRTPTSCSTCFDHRDIKQTNGSLPMAGRLRSGYQRQTGSAVSRSFVYSSQSDHFTLSFCIPHRRIRQNPLGRRPEPVHLHLQCSVFLNYCSLNSPCFVCDGR